MSTWAAFAAKGAAVAATTAAGAGAARAITPGVLDGFAAGTLLTGMCFLVVIAPRTMRKSRLSARRSLWSATMRHARVRPDYYAAPADTHSVAPVLDAPVLAAPVPAAAETAAAQPPQQTQTPLPDMPQPEMPLSFADPALEVFSPAAGQDFAGHAGADPYAPGVLDPVSYAPGIPAAGGFGSADGFGSAGGFDTSPDDDIVLPGDDDAAQDSGRGYRSKHRLTSQDSGDRRSAAKRRPPRHAAPPTRFGARMSGKLAMFPLVRPAAELPG